jgi:hypothetical protein
MLEVFFLKDEPKNAKDMTWKCTKVDVWDWDRFCQPSSHKFDKEDFVSCRG